MEFNTSELEFGGPPATDCLLPVTQNGGPREPLLKKSISRRRSGSLEKHTAIIGTKAAPIESLDYELIENELFRQDWRSRTRTEILQYVVLKWTFVFLVGLLTGLVGFGMNMAVENIAGVKFRWTKKSMQNSGYFPAVLVYAGCNVALVAISAILVVYISPAAAGSGIPEVKGYLNGVDTPDIFSLKTLVIKVLGGIGSVAGGLIVGKQGPLVHMGACIASLLGQGGSRKYHLTWRGLRYFKNDRDRRDLVTCGSAAGVATAFRAPVGGVLFALEEVTSWWRSPLLWRCFFTTAVVAVVLRTAMDWCSGGRCGLFGEGGLIMYKIADGRRDYGLLELVPVTVIGLIGGILGSLFNHLNSKVVTIYSGWHKEKCPFTKVLLASFVALVTSICGFCLPLLAECRPCSAAPPQSTPTTSCPASGRQANFKAFQCPPGHYNDLATLFFNTNDDAIRNLFSNFTNGEYKMSSLMIFLATVYILALLTYGIAVPSGLFVPAILCGATYGRAVGALMNSVGNAKLDEGVYALLGSASFLGGSMRATVSLCIILLELTDNLEMLPLIMLTLLVSKTVGDSFNDAIFDLHIKMKGFPFLDAYPEPYMRRLSAEDAISGPVVKVNVVEKVGVLVDMLRNTQHNAFAVMDEDGAAFYGLVLRSHIMVLLAKHHFSTPSRPAEVALLNNLDFAKPGSGHHIRMEELDITPEQRDLYVNLRLVTNTSPYTVLRTMSLAKAFTLFRQLGLRHLCVMSRSHEGPPIVGILTRHDFMPGYLFANHPHLRGK